MLCAILYFHLSEEYNRVRARRIKINFTTPKLEILTVRIIVLSSLLQKSEVRVTRKINPYLNPPIV